MVLQETAGSQSDDNVVCAARTEPLWDGGRRGAHSLSSAQAQRDSATPSQRGRPSRKQENGKSLNHTVHFSLSW